MTQWPREFSLQFDPQWLKYDNIVKDTENVLRTVLVYINENSLKNCQQLLDIFPSIRHVFFSFSEKPCEDCMLYLILNVHFYFGVLGGL